MLYAPLEQDIIGLYISIICVGILGLGILVLLSRTIPKVKNLLSNYFNLDDSQSVGATALFGVSFTAFLIMLGTYSIACMNSTTECSNPSELFTVPGFLLAFIVFLITAIPLAIWLIWRRLIYKKDSNNPE